MPSRNRSHQIEDISRGAFIQVLGDRGWVANELWRDYGEDFFVRIFEDGEPTPNTFFAQLKSTDKLEKLLIRDGSLISYQISMWHLRTWHAMTEPVFLFVYDVNSEVFYWQSVDEVVKADSGILEKNTKTLQIHIPKRNALDSFGFARIQEYTAKKHGRLNQEIVGSKQLIKLFEEKTGLRVSYNAVSGMMSIGLPDGRIELHLFGKSVEYWAKEGKAVGMDAATYFATWLWELTQRFRPDDHPRVFGTLEEWLGRQGLVPMGSTLGNQAIDSSDEGDQ